MAQSFLTTENHSNIGAFRQVTPGSVGVVVGAGSVGLISGALLAQNHESVHFYESGSEIGGATRDFSGTGKKIFYAGPQYLLPGYLPVGYDYRQLHSFEHRYGSLTNIGDAWIFKKDFAGPAFPASWIDFEHSSAAEPVDWDTQSLQARLSLYPPPIEENLVGFMKRFLPAASFDAVSGSNASILGIGRVATEKHEEEVVQRKQSSCLWDQLYGAKRSSLGMTFETAAVPKLGFSLFWPDFLEQIKASTRVSLRKRTKINTPYALQETASKEANTKLWAGDPRFPVRHFTKYRLDSLTHKKYLTGIYLSKYDGPSLPYYLNIFSAKGKITRIYVYELQDEVRITLESCAPFADAHELRAEVLPLLDSASIRVDAPVQVLARAEARQYFPMTIWDSKLIRQATQRMGKHGWLESGMDLYDRGSRIRLIKEAIDFQ